jgi:hypothetical protein
MNTCAVFRHKGFTLFWNPKCDYCGQPKNAHHVAVRADEDIATTDLGAPYVPMAYETTDREQISASTHEGPYMGGGGHTTGLGEFRMPSPQVISDAAADMFNAAGNAISGNVSDSSPSGGGSGGFDSSSSADTSSSSVDSSSSSFDSGSSF